MPGIWNQIVVWVQVLALSFLSWVTLGKGPRLSERQGPLDLMELIMLTSQGTGRTLSEYSAGLMQCPVHAGAQLAIPTRTLGSKMDKEAGSPG